MMSFSEYIFSDQFQEDLKADEDFVGEVVTALRDYFNYDWERRNRCIGTVVCQVANSLHDRYLDEEGDEDGAAGESAAIDRDNARYIRDNLA